MAARASNCVGMSAGNDMQDFFSLETWAIARASAELTLPSRKSTLSSSISLRAFWTAVPASPLVESSLISSTVRPRMPPLALTCSTASWHPISSFLPGAA